MNFEVGGRLMTGGLALPVSPILSSWRVYPRLMSNSAEVGFAQLSHSYVLAMKGVWWQRCWAGLPILSAAKVMAWYRGVSTSSWKNRRRMAIIVAATSEGFEQKRSSARKVVRAVGVCPCGMSSPSVRLVSAVYFWTAFVVCGRWLVGWNATLRQCMYGSMLHSGINA